MQSFAIIAALAGVASGNSQGPEHAYVTTLPLSHELAGQGRLGGVAVDSRGAIYVSNFGATVWRVDPDSTVTPLASDLRGSSGNAVMPDGSLLQGSFLDDRVVHIARDGTARTYATGFNGPVGIAVASDGTAYVCNCKSNSISRVTPDGSVSQYAQSDLLSCPNGIVIAPNGDLVVASFKSPTLVRVNASGVVEPWVDVMDDGNAHLAWLGGDLYVTKVESNRIYRVTPDDSVSLFAGTGESGDRDGPALEAQLAHPNGIAAVPGGNSLVVNTIVGEFRSGSPTRLALRKISLLHYVEQAEQSTGQSLDNYRLARELLRKAQTALGGTAVGGFENLRALFRGSALARGQSYRPGPPFDTTRVSGELVFDSDNRMYLEHHSANNGGTDRSFRRVLADSGSWNYWLARKLLSPIGASDVALLRRGPWYAPRTFPHSLVASASRAPGTLRWLGETREDGRALGWISFGIGDDLVANVAIDLATGLPYRVDRLASDRLLGDAVNGVVFDEYRDVAGLMVPHRLTFTLNETDLRVWSLADVRVNEPLAEPLFQAPADVDHAVHPRRFAPAEVAPGVYAVRLYSGPANSYNTMLVVFDDFVAVVEAPLSDAFFPVYRGIAQRVAPGKPIKYVVTTHHHSDHVGGVRQFLAAGVDVVAPPQAAAQIERMATAEPTITRNPLAGSRSAGRIIPVSDSLIISDGSRSLRVLQVGPTPHVEQILVAHVPDAGALFVADLFAIPENRVFPPPSPTFRHFAELFDGIDSRGGIRTIVPAHGVVGTPADIDAAVSVPSN